MRSVPPLRDAEYDDLPGVMALNESALPHVNHIERADLEWFLKHAEYFRVAGGAGALRAFLIGLGPGEAYRSPNYRWFHERYERFMYIDRVVVAADARGMGLGRSLYEDLARRMADRAACLCCEVNLRPANPGSLVFHRRLGFDEVGRQETDGGAKEVSLLLKPLARR